jgi:hypothetical protein
MSGSAAGAAQRLDDNLVEHVIDKAALRSRQALALTCRRFCKLVGTAVSLLDCVKWPQARWHTISPNPWLTHISQCLPSMSFLGTC